MILEGFWGCLIGLKNLVLSTFAKHDPLIIKTSGGFIIGGGLDIRRKGLRGTIRGYEGALTTIGPIWPSWGVEAPLGRLICKVAFQLKWASAEGVKERVVYVRIFLRRVPAFFRLCSSPYWQLPSCNGPSFSSPKVGWHMPGL